MAQPDLCDDPDIWRRVTHRQLAGERLSYFSPTDLLLHLIFHAVYEHRFNNGPLTLADLAYLMKGHAIDWALFWGLSDRWGASRGCLLMLKMVERYYGPQPVEWPQRQALDTLDEVVVTASLLTLRDFEATKGVELQTFMGARSIRDKSRLLIKKIFPSRDSMAHTYQAQKSSPRIYYWYCHRIGQRLVQYLSSRCNRRQSSEANQIGQVRQWLQKN